MSNSVYPNRIKTIFHGVEIVHPHSGKVSRSVISRCIKHLANGYNGETDVQNIANLKKWEFVGCIVLSDVNGKISGCVSASN